MRIISGTTQFNIEDKTAVAIGKFDGVHMGHQKLLKHILDKKDQGMKATIFTFDPPPAVFFSQLMAKNENEKKDIILSQLLTKDEKRRKFEELGVDILVEFPMNTETARTAPEDFVRKILHEQMNAAYLAAGDDLSYGYKGRGDFALLNKLAPELGYRTHAIKKLQMFGRNVSSSFIKEEILQAEMERASELLGEHYYVGGFVEHGKKLGRTIGFPTVNLLPPSEKCLPPFGVYFSEVRIDGRKYHGMTNIGLRPTVSDSGQVSVETYIYDFDEDIYGKYLEIALLTFHRKEQKFSGVEALKGQLRLDLDAGRNFFDYE
ncbi:riboflavin biosynthesis protein RibF [Butyrivibrio sp. INlla16]|uniref:riboflavin biosynthesis protein RibF n=1 Tax=Butyrivibrio sp. INlla16 TaxID=1520807 RepID=UPI0008812C8D|nr:riboflavin biosynthesis protein RibF [Butyrivibrio sp. INlla16]SDB58920.1 riboflavin kinase / FMN adenylyltransferase [Butyrivibrio sp. INlla16]